jgi:hypothetical protein
MRKLLVCVAFLAPFAAVPASASIILVDASSIQGDNVLFNDGTQTAATVFGHTQAGTNVVFTGTTHGGGTIISANGGQARIEGAADASTPNPNDTLFLTMLGFNLASGGTFNNLEFNVFGGNATSATFTLLDDLGNVFNFNQALGNGSNFFGFQGIDGQSISNVSITLNGGGVNDVRQIRLDESRMVSAIPEPATWAMMLLGFGAVGYSMRRRKVAIKDLQIA